MPRLQAAKRDELFKQMDFSAAALEMDWNWNDRQSLFAEARDRKIYAVVHDLRRCSSFWKIPELAEYRKNVRLFSSREQFQDFFHRHTEEYLPQLVFGTEEAGAELSRILEEEHKYRLTPEGRNTDNVLLTIAIPTYNRGNLVLKRLENLQAMLYDAEIEIAISKNGMEKFQEEYEQVAQISDARICYYDHGKTLKATENWRYVVGMAHGKYVMFVSDEDDVILESLEHYLKLLADHPEISVLQSKSSFQGLHLTERGYGKKGLEAFKQMFLTQNYLSGLIVKREDFLQENLARLEQFADNAFYQNYPHEWWCALLGQKGAYMEEPVLLIAEGESAFQKNVKSKLEGLEGEAKEKQGFLPLYATYATYEARLKQFDGIVEFLHWMMDKNAEGAEIGLDKATRKMTHLFMMARKYRYDKKHFKDWVDRFQKMAEDAIAGFDLTETRRGDLLMALKNACEFMLEEHARLNIQEAEES